MNNTTDRFRKFLIGLGVAVVLCVVFGIWSVIETWQFRASAVTAEGVVTEISFDKDAPIDSTQIAAAVVEFEAEGKKHTIRSKVGMKSPYSVGEKVTVHFPPGHPEDGRIRNFLEDNWSALSSFVAAAVLGAFLLFLRRGHNRQAFGVRREESGVRNQTIDP